MVVVILVAIDLRCVYCTDYSIDIMYLWQIKWLLSLLAHISDM